jgi:hypothetical protein
MKVECEKALICDYRLNCKAFIPWGYTEILSKCGTRTKVYGTAKFFENVHSCRCYAPMESKRSLGAKSLRAAGRKPVKNEIQREINDALHHRMIVGRSEPPPLNFVKTVVERRRWNMGGAVTNQGFSLANGHDQFLVVTSALGAAVCIADSWRIRKISVYAVAQDNLQTGVTLTPTGADNSSNMMNDPESAYHLLARSPAEPVSMHIIPSETKPLGSWHFSSNVNVAGTLFQMNVTTGGGTSDLRVTLDIEFEVRYNKVGLPLGYGVTTATTTLGAYGGRNILSGFSLVGINNLG